MTGPANITLPDNNYARFRVEAMGADLRYQWQYSANNGGTWINSTTAGYNTAEMTLSAAAHRNGYLYRCAVTNDIGTTMSLSAKLTVSGVAPVIRAQPVSVTSAASKTVKFKVSAAGADLRYQWQYSANNGGTWINSTTAGYNTAEMTLSAAAHRNGYLYRCAVTNDIGTAISGEAKLTVQ